jgi:hypothetical protein
MGNYGRILPGADGLTECDRAGRRTRIFALGHTPNLTDDLRDHHGGDSAPTMSGEVYSKKSSVQSMRFLQKSGPAPYAENASFSAGIMECNGTLPPGSVTPMRVIARPRRLLVI